MLSKEQHFKEEEIEEFLIIKCYWGDFISFSVAALLNLLTSLDPY